MWLTAFTDVLEQLLKVSSTVSLASNIETIKDVLLGLVNIKFVYNANQKTFMNVLPCIEGVTSDAHVINSSATTNF